MPLKFYLNASANCHPAMSFSGDGRVAGARSSCLDPTLGRLAPNLALHRGPATLGFRTLRARRLYDSAFGSEEFFQGVAGGLNAVFPADMSGDLRGPL